MNNFERQELISDYVIKFTPRQLASMLIDMEEDRELLDSILSVDVDEMLQEVKYGAEQL